MTVSSNTEVRRGRGRPRSFPDQQTKMAGFNLPVETLELLQEAAQARGVTQNALVDRAIRSLLRNRKG